MKRWIMILAVVAFMIATTGCTASSSGDGPEEAVNQALTYYRDNNFTDFNKMLTSVPSSLDLPNTGKTKGTIKAVTDISFTVKETKTTGNKATVKTEFNVIYLPEILNNYVNEYFNAQLSGELTEDIDSQAYADDLFDKLLSSPDVRRETRDIDINLEKSGSWKIVPDESLINILLGLQNE